MTPASNRRHVLRALEALKRPIRGGAATHVFTAANTTRSSAPMTCKRIRTDLVPTGSSQV